MKRGPSVEFIHAKQVLNRVTAPTMPFSWSINPYRGCTHGCSFCYARDTHTYLGMSADDTFQNHIYVKENAADVLRTQLRRKLSKFGGDKAQMAHFIGTVAIGTATDPYQPMEAKQKRTRACLEVLAEYGVPVTVTTRSPLVLRDIDLLLQTNIQTINISINTLNTRTWRSLEPATPSPMKRLETVKTLSEHGLPVGVLMAPIIPCLTDAPQELNALMAEVSAHGAQFAIPSFLRLTPMVKAWFYQTVERAYPDVYKRLSAHYRGSYPTSTYTDSIKRCIEGFSQKYSLPLFPNPALAKTHYKPESITTVRSQGQQLTLSLFQEAEPM